MALKASLAVINSNIITLNPDMPYAEALAVKNGKYLKVGSNDEIFKIIDNNTVLIDASDLTVLPGFIDAHVHILGYELSKRILDLRKVFSIEEILKLIKIKISEVGKGKWILGRGWDQERIKEGRPPLKEELDKVAPENPVLLVRICGHLGVLNTVGIEKLKLKPDKYADLNTGIIKEEVLKRAIKSATSIDVNNAIELISNFLNKAAAKGITCVHAMSSSIEEIKGLLELRSKGELRIRVRVYMEEELLDQDIDVIADDMLKINGVKVFCDGSLGARTAALSFEYYDKPGENGILLKSTNELKKILVKAKERNLQVAIHAIGDRAIDTILRTISEIDGNVNIRVEHASICPPWLIKKLFSFSIPITIQPNFIISDFWIIDRVGVKRASWVYPFKSFIDNSITVGIGSDAPVEPLNPFIHIKAAVTRGGNNHPLCRLTENEKLSVKEALQLYTRGSAKLGLDEYMLGMIKDGLLADFIIVDRNPLDINVDDLDKINVLMTVVGGNIVYNNLV